ncbi:hypothetical protein NA57DRAFT_62237 [Rhizodiscina lignyota]|uniref:Uncharacterized protein n=1 Tax=Rhizodiscina lignyota TaxID=1504668 RepID=A0A9P4I306_9PEZI|nr:hypothetical protein NA57DRAFT_62237 [Rhizodiscina lignyota]
MDRRNVCLSTLTGVITILGGAWFGTQLVPSPNPTSNITVATNWTGDSSIPTVPEISPSPEPTEQASMTTGCVVADSNNTRMPFFLMPSTDSSILTTYYNDAAAVGTTRPEPYSGRLIRASSQVPIRAIYDNVSDTLSNGFVLGLLLLAIGLLFPRLSPIAWHILAIASNTLIERRGSQPDSQHASQLWLIILEVVLMPLMFRMSLQDPLIRVLMAGAIAIVACLDGLWYTANAFHALWMYIRHLFWNRDKCQEVMQENMRVEENRMWREKSEQGDAYIGRLRRFAAGYEEQRQAKLYAESQLRANNFMKEADKEMVRLQSIEQRLNAFIEDLENLFRALPDRCAIAMPKVVEPFRSEFAKSQPSREQQVVHCINSSLDILLSLYTEQGNTVAELDKALREARASEKQVQQNLKVLKVNDSQLKKQLDEHQKGATTMKNNLLKSMNVLRDKDDDYRSPVLDWAEKIDREFRSKARDKGKDNLEGLQLMELLDTLINGVTELLKGISNEDQEVKRLSKAVKEHNKAFKSLEEDIREYGQVGISPLHMHTLVFQGAIEQAKISTNDSPIERAAKLWFHFRPALAHVVKQLETERDQNLIQALPEEVDPDFT